MKERKMDGVDWVYTIFMAFILCFAVLIVLSMFAR